MPTIIVVIIKLAWHFTLVHNVKNMKCTGLKAVSYPDTRHLIKGSTAKPRTMPVYFIFSVSVRLF